MNSSSITAGRIPVNHCRNRLGSATLTATISPHAAASGDPAVLLYWGAKGLVLLIAAVYIGLQPAISFRRMAAFTIIALGCFTLFLLGLVPNYMEHQVWLEVFTWAVTALTVFLGVRELKQG
ncbi:MAG: hypothetical protein ACLGI6_13040 [Gammaproteobacteria bacterium]